MLVAVNGAALLMVSGMSDLAVSTRLATAGVVVLNVTLLIGRRALSTRPARWGVMASLGGYVGAVVFWLVTALGCGIEYVNTRCDAVVMPVLAAAVALSLAGLPLGRLGALFVRR
jgi:hypothetical protein